MGFKGSKKKILTATLGSFLLFQQPLMTVVEAAELSDNKHHKTEKVTKHESTAKSVKHTEDSQAQNKETKASTTESTPKPEQPTKITVKDSSNSKEETCQSLKDAVSKVKENGTIKVSGAIALEEAITIDKKGVKLVAEENSSAIIKKKTTEINMVQVKDGGELTLSGDITFDGESKDCNKAMVQVDKGGHFIMEDKVVLKNASCNWQDFATINNLGTTDMKGGQIINGSAARNAGIFVAKDSIFNMLGGKITKCHVSHTNAAGGVQGTFNMTGGEITDNNTSWADGGILIYKGGQMNFTGGQIHDNKSDNKSGVSLEEGAKLELGKNSDLSENLVLRGDTTKVDVKSSSLAAYSAKKPLNVIVDKPKENRPLFVFDNETAASKARPDIQVQSQKDKTKLPLVVDSSNKKQLDIASEAQMKDLDVLNNPYTDKLGFEFKTQLMTEDGREKLKKSIEAIYQGVESSEKKFYEDRLEYLTKQYKYVTDHKDELKKSIQTLSELGDPGAEQARTQQSYRFDNLDATGFYLKPGQVNTINVYVDSQNPNKVQLSTRQTGTTENNDYHSLDKRTFNLKNGWNQIKVDLTSKKYGEMIYFQNNSTDNDTKVRIEGVEANETNTIEGKSMGRHSMFIYDGKNEDKFKQYLDDVNKQVAAVEKTKNKETKDQVQDMTFIQVGTTQLAMRATLMKKIAEQEKLTDQATAAQYVKNLYKYMKERIDYFWEYAGFSSKETGTNSISPLRLYVAFTTNVTSPSTMYAFVYYYHMPENTAKDFMNGSALYGWGMSHEYGHMLDNQVLVVGEQTNNMYSLWGARNQGIKNFKEKHINTFDVEASNTVYHGGMKKAYNELNTYLSQVAQGKKPEKGAFMAGDHFFRVMPWFLGTHYFDDWDYSNYDFDKSPYTKEIADQVKEFGAYGTTLRLMRSTSAKQEVEKLSSNHYFRMVAAFTMATGYNFAEYMEAVGETDIPQNVKDFCKQYPSMPRKLQYYSLNADGKQIMGYKPYSGRVEPTIEVKQENGKDVITTKMANDDQEKSTIAYELYKDGKLADFSRTGKFEVENKSKSNEHYAVKTYDFRLTPSRMSGDKTSLKVKDVTITQGDKWENKDAFVSATDSEGKEVNFDKVKVTGKVDTNKPGTYELTFEYDGEKATAKVTVKKKEEDKKPVYHKDGCYASVVKDDYTIWGDLDFKKKKGNTKSLYKDTVKVKGYYDHPNGSKYASLYNDKDQWLGYVNAGAVEYQKTAGGKMYSVKKYAAVVKDNYTIWNDFDFKKKKGNTKSLYKDTVYVKGEYHHFNGSTYASLYNDKDQWLGYVNMGALKLK